MQDMIVHGQEAIDLMHGLSREEFLSDRARQLAVTHLVTIVGEAAAQVSAEQREASSDLPWTKIVGT